MKRTPAIAASIVLVITVIAVAQTTRPTKESAEDIAKRLGTTVERLERMVKRNLGEPVVVDNGLIVGVDRDAAGHVTTVKITDDVRSSIEFNREPSDTRPGFRMLSGDLGPDPTLSSATDFDGDGRIDQISFKSRGKPATILIRLGERFEPAIAAGGGKRFTLTSTGRTQRFELTQREWVDDSQK